MKFAQFYLSLLVLCLLTVATKCSTNPPDNTIAQAKNETETLSQNQTLQSHDEVQSKSEEIPDKQPSEMTNALLEELNALQNEISTNQKRVSLLEQLRTTYVRKNQSTEKFDLNTIEETLAKEYAFQSGEKGLSQKERERSDSINSLKNKIMKKFSFELMESIKQFSFLPTKQFQKSLDEPTTSSLIVFLTNNNTLLIYDINGNLQLVRESERRIKSFTVNPLLDEYYIATLSDDNALRVYTLKMDKVKDSETAGKKDKSKFTLEFDLKLEYTYDLETQTILPEQLIKEVSKNRVEKNFTGLTTVLSKPFKYLTLIDETGALLLIHRNGTFKSRFEQPNSKFISIQKAYPHPLFATKDHVGYLNPNTLELLKPECEAPGGQILKVEIDLYSTGHFHLLLENGLVLFYEVKQGGCKVIGKEAFSASDLASNILSAKNFVLVQQDKKGLDLLAYNLTDLYLSGIDEIETYKLELYPFKTDQDQLQDSKYTTMRNSPTTTLIGAYNEFENSTAVFTLYEMTVVLKPQSDWFSNLRAPLIVTAVLLVVGYQFLMKKKSKPSLHHHKHGPDCDHEHEETPLNQSRARLQKMRQQTPVDDVTRRHQVEEVDFKRRATDNYSSSLRGQGASRTQKEKRVSFEEDDY